MMLEINAIKGSQEAVVDTSHKSSGPSNLKGDQVINSDSSDKEVQDKVALSTPKNSSYLATYVEELENISKEVDSFLKSIKRHLNFNVELGKGLISVEVIEDATGRVIRRIPPDVWARMVNTEGSNEMREILSSL